MDDREVGVIGPLAGVRVKVFDVMWAAAVAHNLRQTTFVIATVHFH